MVMFRCQDVHIKTGGQKGGAVRALQANNNIIVTNFSLSSESKKSLAMTMTAYFVMIRHDVCHSKLKHTIWTCLCLC